VQLEATSSHVNVMQDEPAEDEVEAIVGQTRLLERRGHCTKRVGGVAALPDTFANDLNHALAHIQCGDLRTSFQKAECHIALATAGVEYWTPPDVSCKVQERNIQAILGTLTLQKVDVERGRQRVVKRSFTGPHV